MDPHVDVHVDDRGDIPRAGRDLEGLTGSLSSAGSAAAGFGGQFAVGAGVVGSAIPVIAGLAAMLAEIAPAAATAASGMLMMASAAAAIKIGTSGIGGAIKAAFADAPAAAGAATNAAQQYADAQRAVKDAIDNAAYSNAQAAQHVTDAERNLADAEKADLSAQQALVDARKQAAMDLEDLNNKVTDAALGQRDATLRVQDAKTQLDTTLANPAATQAQREQAQLAYDEAVQHLREQGIAYQRLQDQAAAANKAGVDGAANVVKAQDQITAAQRKVGDETRAVQDAQTQQARTAYQGAEQVQKAIEALGQAGKGAAGGGVDPLAQALAKLSPAARAFVEEIIRLKPQLEALKLDVQQSLFSGLDATLARVAAVSLPVLRQGLVGTAGELNGMATGVLNAAGHLSESGILGRALAFANTGLANLARVPGQVVTGFGEVAQAAGPALDRITGGVGRMADTVASKLSAAFSSGGMQRAIDLAVTLLGQLGTVVANLGGLITEVLGAANASGGGFVNTLVTISGALQQAFATPAVQDGLKALFAVTSSIASTAAPLLMQALQVIGPVLSALGPPIQVLVQALGSGLQQIITALGPVLLTAAQAVGQLVVAAAPLLPLIGQLAAALLPAVTPLLAGIGTIAQQLAPVVAALAGAIGQLLGPVLAVLPQLITPVVTILTSLTGAVLPVLTQLITQLPLQQLGESFAQIAVALAPVLAQLAVLVGQVLTALMPLLTPIIGAVAQLANIFAGQLARTIQLVVVPAMQFLTDLLSGNVHGAVHDLGQLLSGLGQIVLDEFTKLPQQIVGVLGDLASKLFDAGSKIIQSLINGIKSKVGDVKDELSSLTDKIVSWKGPPDRDGVLLHGAGQLIMDGLMRGIDSRVPALRGQLQGITGQIGGMGGSPFGAPAMAGAGGGAGGFHIQNYYESQSGSARATAEELWWMGKARG
jgi:phage-related protein